MAGSGPARGGSAPLRGALGERMGARYLVEMGWRVLERNVRYPFGEIDIVAHDGSQLVFVEVRLRKANPFQGAADTVGPRKLRRLEMAARAFAESRDFSGSYRIDLLAIEEGPSGFSFELYRDITGG
ncbi:MAG: YraN family protein [Thermanaerothrix sp.]|nr:YraN family protein [Thermanaerothrix sp.]